MTRTQLQEMSDRDLVSFTRRRGVSTSGPEKRMIIEELANRLDDRYPFNPEPTTETAE